MSRCTILIKNLDRKVNEEILRNIFSDCGRIRLIAIYDDKTQEGKKLADILFESTEQATRAVEAMDKKRICQKEVIVEIKDCKRDQESFTAATINTLAPLAKSLSNPAPAAARSFPDQAPARSAQAQSVPRHNQAQSTHRHNQTQSSSSNNQTQSSSRNNQGQSSTRHDHGQSSTRHNQGQSSNRPNQSSAKGNARSIPAQASKFVAAAPPSAQVTSPKTDPLIIQTGASPAKKEQEPVTNTREKTIGMRIFPLAKQKFAPDAAKITGMLIETIIKYQDSTEWALRAEAENILKSDTEINELIDSAYKKLHL